MPRLLPFVSVVLLGCGGKVVVDTAAEADAVGATSGSGASGAGGGGTATATVAASTSIASTGATSGGSCEGQACGTFCEICQPDCVSGHCDGKGTCSTEFQGGPDQCPPPDEVAEGVACAPEGVWCPSNSSCSGALVCICGGWVLVNPC